MLRVKAMKRGPVEWGTGEGTESLRGRGAERVGKGRGQCLVQRKRLGCFKEGTKCEEFERCLLEVSGSLQDRGIAISLQSFHFFK